MSTFAVSSPGDASAVLVQKGPCQLHGYHLANANASARYAKLYDAAAAADVTVGTTLPKLRIPVTGSNLAWAANLQVHFKLGMVVAVVTGAADTDTTGGSARDIAGALVVNQNNQP
jgi:hypothetical protein